MIDLKTVTDFKMVSTRGNWSKCKLASMRTYQRKHT